MTSRIIGINLRESGFWFRIAFYFLLSLYFFEICIYKNCANFSYFIYIYALNLLLWLSEEIARIKLKHLPFEVALLVSARNVQPLIKDNECERQWKIYYEKSLTWSFLNYLTWFCVNYGLCCAMLYALASNQRTSAILLVNLLFLPDFRLRLSCLIHTLRIVMQLWYINEYDLLILRVKVFFAYFRNFDSKKFSNHITILCS